MPDNIDKIGLWTDNPKSYNSINLVKIDFKFPCTWTVLSLEDLKAIIEKWLEGEARVYPMIKEGPNKCHFFQFIYGIFKKQLGWK
jgi:hypothetical protein